MTWFRKSITLLLNQASVVLFIAVLAGFGVLQPKFLQPSNLVNIVIQSSSTAIVAIGMSFVLLTAGVDLSVGAIMFIAAAVGGKLVLGGASLFAALMAMMLIGLACGVFNALFIVRLRVIPFIATLGSLYAGRGLGLWLTETRAMNLPGSFLALGSGRVAGIPIPLLILGGVMVLAHIVLAHTPFGRQLYAIGQDMKGAREAGIKTRQLLAAVYLISGTCAALGGIVSLAQLGAVSPTFGEYKEFSAISAAVLGGVSLFGGRGQVFPGTLLGAILIQSVENGLVLIQADPYLYPMVTSGIIFLAVLTDSARNVMLARLSRRKIRVEETAESV